MVFVLPYIPAVTERPVTLPIDSYWNLSMQLTGIDFRDMSKTMWLVLIIYGALSTGILNILLKLFVLFFILRLFFFPDFLAGVDGGEEDYVSRELIERAAPIR